METKLKKIVGQRLQLLRMEKNLTQEQMGERLNLSTSAYCKIEYGETDLTLTRLNKIAHILNMSAAELFSKINDNLHFTGPGSMNAVAPQEYSYTPAENSDLRELIKANNKLIEMLEKRIEMLEKHLS